MNKMEELCRLVNGKYIQSFTCEKKYLLEEDYLRLDFILVLMPNLNYLGEQCLKINFYNVCDLLCAGLESGLFELEINVEDIRDRHWENCRYYVHDGESGFELKCEDFDYEWIIISE